MKATSDMLSNQLDKKEPGDFRNCESVLVQLVRLALTEQTEDVRLFVARMARSYRSDNPELAQRLADLLRAQGPRSAGMLREAATRLPAPTEPMPADEAAMTLLRRPIRAGTGLAPIPLLAPEVLAQLRQVVAERRKPDVLTDVGLSPTRSAMFVGPPGVGKTMAARWIASQLDTPLYVLDLTAVMSSLLGRSGTNLRTVLDFAKSRPCVLLLDEIDAIAKRRGDETDVGEMKRLVTIILQELDDWPPLSLLLAATNHPELLDAAVWRRFDVISHFDLPGPDAMAEALRRFLGPDVPAFEAWIEALAFAFTGRSLADVERDAYRIRRSLALGMATAQELAKEAVTAAAPNLKSSDRIKLARGLAERTDMSQHAISGLTGVSRDTLRKRATSSDDRRLTPAVRATNRQRAKSIVGAE